jgi:uncharacterized metal-binding protein
LLAKKSMPSGSIHDRITLWSFPWVAGVTLIATRSSEITLIASSAFLFSGLMFGPDLDIYSRQFQRWGKLRWIWLPYQKTLRHRSKFSHGILIGTIIRLFYLFSVAIVFATAIVAIAQSIWGFDWNWQHFIRNSYKFIVEDYPIQAIAFFLGLELGAFLHSLSDWIHSTSKKKEGRRQKAEGR